MAQPSFEFTIENVFYIKPPVDRVILVGTVYAGTVEAGDAATVNCRTGAVKVTVEGIETVQQANVQQAAKGEQVGLRVRGIAKDVPAVGDRVTGNGNDVRP